MGLRVRRRAACGRSSNAIRRKRRSARRSITIPRARRRADEHRLPRKGLEPQRAGETHAVRRLPRPWLGFMAVYKRDRKATSSTRTTTSSRSVIPTNSKGRSPERHPPREGDALRGLPLLAGRARQRPDLRRIRQQHRDRVPGLPRHDRRVYEPPHVRTRRARGRDRPPTRQHPVRAAPLRVAADRES